MKKKDIIYISIGLILSVAISTYLNSISSVELDIGSLISWILAITMIIIFIGITVCSFLLAKPLSKIIKL
jgi:hypothetical protein